MSKKNLVTTSLVSLLSSTLAFLGIIGCCGFPLIAAFLAWFGIGASQLGFFADYQTIFTSVAITSLIYGFYTIYFKKSIAKSENDCCKVNIIEEGTIESSCSTSKPSSNVFAKSLLWLAAFAVGSSFFMNDSNATGGENSESNCCVVENVQEVEEAKTSPCCEIESVVDRTKKQDVVEDSNCCSKK